MKLNWTVLPEDANPELLRDALIQMIAEVGYDARLGKVIVDEHMMTAMLEVARDGDEFQNLCKAVDIMSWRLAIFHGKIPQDTPYEK